MIILSGVYILIAIFGILGSKSSTERIWITSSIIWAINATINAN